MTEAIRLLYAEDNAQDADLTRTYFEHEAADFALEVVETGAQCLARLAAEHFDLLLLDKRLPDMDGLDLLARLRAGGQGLPVVMVTGIGDDETVARALRAGAADYVPKSADYLSTLPAILRGVVARERQRRPLDEKGGQRVQRILYVEPNPMDVELTRSHFAAQAPHLALHSVSDASEALALLEPGLGQAFDLVLTDLRLPGMNSLEFIHEAQQRGINLPFIVITGRGDEATAVALLRLGAYDYLLKRENYLTKLPFTIDNVLERFKLDQTARRLHGKLESLNATLEQQVATRTAELQAEIQRRTALESQQREQLDELTRTQAESHRLLDVAERSRQALLAVLEDQKRAEAALQENQRLLAETEKIGKVGGWEFDIATGKQSWTPEVYHIHEVDASFDPSVETGINFYTPASRPIIERAVQRAVAHGEPFDLELEITTAKGHPRSVHTIGKVDQERRRIHGFFQDITEKKRAEEERRQIFERITDAFVALDKNWCYTYVNPKAEQLFGRQAQDLIGKHIWTEFPEGVGQPFQLAYEQAMADQQAATLEEYYPPFDRWFENRIYPSPDGLTIYFHDITERKRVEAALHQAEQDVRNAYERFQKIFMGAPEAMSISEMQSGRLVLVNDAFCKTFGRAHADLIGHTSFELGLWSDPSRRGKVVAALRAGHTLRGVEGQTRQTNGALRDVIYSAEVLQLDQQEHLLLMFTDITERKRAETALQKLNAELEQRVAERTAELVVARDRAEAADRIKSSFLATMSHELRTPLNSVIGFTGVLLQKIPGPLNAEQEKQLNFVLKAGRHLLALISDVLDISKVEAGELHLAREPFDFSALLARVGAAFALEAGHRGLAFKLVPCPNPSMLTGDARRVEQVLNNLISNALKFTAHGTITLACEREDHGLVVSVSDTGVGIKPEDINKLFRPFSQIETGLSGLREGTGLGLAITKHLVEAMGGEVRVESTWGQGSRFSFTLSSTDRASHGAPG